jgi:hypothetical protein
MRERIETEGVGDRRLVLLAFLKVFLHTLCKGGRKKIHIHELVYGFSPCEAKTNLELSTLAI